jgi:hypothetical protein
VRDVAGLALNDELHGTLARSAGRKVLATNDDTDRADVLDVPRGKFR